MKKLESHRRYSGAGIDSPSEHVSFSAGVARSERRGEVFKQLRQVNLSKAASARTSRPHKTG